MSEDILSLSLSPKSVASEISFHSNDSFELSQKDNQEICSLLGIGDPIVDIIGDITSETIREYNLELGGSILANEDESQRIIEVYKKIENMKTVNYIPGGSVQNTMRILSWCLNNDSIKREKYTISMLGSVGDDIYKDKILDALNAIGVNSMLEILQNDKTSRCAVGIFQKEKLFVTQLRASKRLSENFIEENLDKILEHQALIIEGYLLNNKFNIVKKLCDYFSRNKKLIILTLSANFIVKLHYEKLIELGNKADIINGSLGEAKEFAMYQGDNVKDIFKIIFKKLKPKENRLLVITDGPNGAYCSKYNYENDELESFIHYPANFLKEDEIKDLNGAGDAFLGGFLSEYIKGSSLYHSIQKGINAATIILKNVGCTFPKEVKISKIKEDY